MNQLAPSLYRTSPVRFEICFASHEIPYWNLAIYQHFYKTQPYDKSWRELNPNIRRALLDLEDEGRRSFKTSGTTRPVTLLYIPEDWNVQLHRRETPLSHTDKSGSHIHPRLGFLCHPPLKSPSWFTFVQS